MENEERDYKEKEDKEENKVSLNYLVKFKNAAYCSDVDYQYLKLLSNIFDLEKIQNLI